MREWRLLRTSIPCGRCSAPIPKGTPILEIHFVGNGTKRARCPACAKAMFGEDPPAVIEAVQDPAVGPAQQPFAAGRSRKRFDPKLAQLSEGDR